MTDVTPRKAILKKGSYFFPFFFPFFLAAFFFFGIAPHLLSFFSCSDDLFHPIVRLSGRPCAVAPTIAVTRVTADVPDIITRSRSNAPREGSQLWKARDWNEEVLRYESIGAVAIDWLGFHVLDDRER